MVELILKIMSFTGVVAAVAICTLMVFGCAVILIEIVRAFKDIKEGK